MAYVRLSGPIMLLLSANQILTYSFAVIVLKRQHFAVEPLFVPTRKTWDGARMPNQLNCWSDFMMMTSIVMLWARAMKKVPWARKSRNSTKVMDAPTIASIDKTKTPLECTFRKNELKNIFSWTYSKANMLSGTCHTLQHIISCKDTPVMYCMFPQPYLLLEMFN